MIWTVIFAALLVSGIEASIQCRDENGNAVDWYVVYKFPKISDTTLGATGLNYMYITSDNTDGWTVSDLEIGDDSSIFGQTLAPLYDSSTDEALWLVYNDQGSADSTTSTSSSSYGHTKGAVGGDEEGGFWLIHSVPHFPGLTSYKYPSTGRKYGQSAMCVSFDAENLDLVGELLQLNTPNFLVTSISDSLTSLYPNLVSASEGETASSTSEEITLQSKAGTVFEGFGKSAKYGKDLYEWVAKSLESTLYMEGWINQSNRLSSTCDSTYNVINIASISIEDADLSFKTSNDHSKWAVSASSSSPYVCVGDINRVKSQKKRGGGTLCTSNSDLWSAYNALIASADECS